ncbi:MAG: T9SS type A sorting domain-containing protein [Lentimicrobiaceae bacterium]|nr:T9SS type A sorting domain-containing protein [Lentimicrobiaceae bacterium]
MLMLVMCLGAYSSSWAAEERITFTWKVGAATILKDFRLSAINNVVFTVDWGDGEVETMTGTGSWETIKHHYLNYRDYTVVISTMSPNIFTHFDCKDRLVTDLKFMNCLFLEELHCYDNQLVTLNLAGCDPRSMKYVYCFNNQLEELTMYGERIYCYNNRLPLSNLYIPFIIIMGDTIKPDSTHKRYGTQTLPVVTVKEGDTVDFSAQAEFAGILTDFAVERNGSTATRSDYSINNGIITFTNTGTYKITMTNDAIMSEKRYPAEVVAEFLVGNVDISNYELGDTNYVLYPNPTTGKFSVFSSQFSEMGGVVEIYDVVGKQYSVGAKHVLPNEEIEIDISHLANGLYFLKIDGKTVKVVKQ